MVTPQTAAAAAAPTGKRTAVFATNARRSPLAARERELPSLRQTAPPLPTAVFAANRIAVFSFSANRSGKRTAVFASKLLVGSARETQLPSFRQTPRERNQLPPLRQTARSAPTGKPTAVFAADRPLRSDR